MTPTPGSFRELIAALGGPAKAALKTPFERTHLQSMSERDSVAPEHWPALETAASDAGICVDASDFARWRANKARARREERSAA
jgi:hypothetical protein